MILALSNASSSKYYLGLVIGMVIVAAILGLLTSYGKKEDRIEEEQD